MSVKSQPKARFSTRIPNGDYLSFAVWQGKSDPTAEIINIQIRRSTGTNWETVGKLSIYRTLDGRYSQLPERK
jgi:hypothetical protein